MELSRFLGYAVLQTETLNSPPSFKILHDFPKILQQWKPSTRISTVFGVEEFSTVGPSEWLFEGENYFIFLGPINPLKLQEFTPTNANVWLSLGILNAIINVKSSKDASSITKWAGNAKISYEKWHVVNGLVVKVNCFHPNQPIDTWRGRLADIANANIKPELRDSCEEFLPLLASTVSRAEQYLPHLPRQLNLIADSIKDGLKICSEIPAGQTAYEFAGILTSINAALSRLSSQAFSGTPPISQTECHFWSHSLFGIGIATIGFWKLTNFINFTLGEERVPDRFLQLKNLKPNDHDLFSLREHEDYWHKDHIGSVIVTDKSEPILPLVPYFSGRDGFKSTFNTISAPLAIITSCNCINWPLLTVTHEVSHTLIKSVLSDIYPDFNSSEAIEQSLALLRKDIKCQNLYQQIQQLLFFSICSMNYVETGESEIPDNYNDFRALLDGWHHEVEEIMVSVFDFLYFYGRKSEQYIQGIWSSWSVIPNIYNRVHEYVVRSICAVLSIHLRRTSTSGQSYSCEEYARDQIVLHLSALKDTGYNSPYIDEALNYIAEQWDDIKEQVVARKDIVKIVKAFLYSETVESKLKSESKLTSSSAGHYDGYSFKPKQFDRNLIDNPLRFLEYYTKGMTPSKVDSAWMFYTLAFNVTDYETESN